MAAQRIDLARRARCLLLLVGSLLLAGCPPQEPVEPPPPLPPLARVPAEYWVEAEGAVEIAGVGVPGKVRMHYAVHHDGEVSVRSLVAWMDDLDLAVDFLFWEVDTEPLRCSQFRNPRPLAGELDGSQLEIPAGAEMIGISYTRRGPKGECLGEARRMDVKTPSAIVATHDPDNDHFEVAASFETVVAAEPVAEAIFELIPGVDAPQATTTVTVAFDMQGHYQNRPPVAALVSIGDGVDMGSDGCPATREDVDPPMALANTPDGLEVTLRSQSYDPDGGWPDELQQPKLKRIDLQLEQWSRTKDGELVFLGGGQEISPVLFENDREHQLLLWITDRRGAEARKVCRFVVQSK